MFKVYWARGGRKDITMSGPHVTHDYDQFDQGSTGWSASGLTVADDGLYLVSGGASMSPRGTPGPNWAAAYIKAPGLSLSDIAPFRADGGAHSRSIAFNSRPVQLSAGDKITVQVRPVGTKTGIVQVNGASIYAVRLTPDVLITGTPTAGDVAPDE